MWEPPDSRPHVLCREVGSRLVAVAPALRPPLPAVILPVTQARCCSGRPRSVSPSGEDGAGQAAVMTAFRFQGLGDMIEYMCSDEFPHFYYFPPLVSFLIINKEKK